MSDPVVFIFFPNPQVLRWILAVVELDRIAVPAFGSLGRCKAPVIQLSSLLLWLLYERVGLCTSLFWRILYLNFIVVLWCNQTCLFPLLWDDVLNFKYYLYLSWCNFSVLYSLKYSTDAMAFPLWVTLAGVGCYNHHPNKTVYYVVNMYLFVGQTNFILCSSLLAMTCSM